jgi:small conductance mechanosensitive channel
VVSLGAEFRKRFSERGLHIRARATFGIHGPWSDAMQSAATLMPPCRFLQAVLFCLHFATIAIAQQPEISPPAAETTEETTAPAATVEIDPRADDEAIEQRLAGILLATEWFENPTVRVDEGVVFLGGGAKTDEHRTFAGDLARNTQDVVAVVNRIEVVPGPVWDLTPAYAEVRSMTAELVQSLPTFIASLLLILVTIVVTLVALRIAHSVARRRVENRLLQVVAARTIVIPIVVIGLYLALRVSGLTRLAATVLGGTGLVGIVLGIAFRDIAENFLASLLISLQSPYRIGDTIIVAGEEGVVQSVTTRGTQLMTFEGNHVQIPNSTVYKSIIHNVTSNPKLRLDFVVGIDYEDAVARAQEIILQVLESHEAVLKDPEPMVLVDQLAASTVNLRVYYWINLQQNSKFKAHSSVMRLVKVALQKAGVSLPDESREIIFPKGVPVMMQQEPMPDPEVPAPVPTEQVVSRGEGSLKTDVPDLQRQAAESRNMTDGENLLSE